jgi:wyosine [tRNA(Phe)-imidazoG37] synthetase (radical SAM superfamily)
MRKIFYGAVVKSKLILTEQSKYAELVRSLEGKEIELSIGPRVKHRSNNQNRYYHGVVLRLISEHTGYTPDETHDAMRMLFLRDDRRRVPTLLSTTDLSTVEFEEYLKNIREWASKDIQIYIPEPNEVEYEHV